jgi:hypothetical protein
VVPELAVEIRPIVALGVNLKTKHILAPALNPVAVVSGVAPINLYDHMYPTLLVKPDCPRVNPVGVLGVEPEK